MARRFAKWIGLPLRVAPAVARPAALLMLCALCLLQNACTANPMPGGYSPGYSYQSPASVQGQCVQLPYYGGAYPPAVQLPQQIGGPAVRLVNPTR